MIRTLVKSSVKKGEEARNTSLAEKKTRRN